MSRRVYITLLFLLPGMVIQAQRLERSVIVPAGGSAHAGGAGISWSAGEAATLRYRGPDGTSLTQGFQQPYFSIAHVRTEDFAGRPGDTSTMHILMDQFQGIYGAGVSAIELQLQFNATLLEPIIEPSQTAIVSDDIDGGIRTLVMRLPVRQVGMQPDVLATMRFAVGLGNDSTTTMALLAPRPVDGPLRLSTSSGAFKLLGICYQGGPRLVDPVRRPTIQLRPNPASSAAVVEFDIHEEGNVTANVVDMFGRTVQALANESLKEGHYSLTFDAGTIASGSYIVVLQTRSARISHPFVVQR